MLNTFFICFTVLMLIMLTINCTVLAIGCISCFIIEATPLIRWKYPMMIKVIRKIEAIMDINDKISSYVILAFLISIALKLLLYGWM